MIFSYSTSTASRVEEVMKAVFDELIGVAQRGFVELETAQKWRDDLTFMLSRRAISRFELQLTLPDGRHVGFRYTVSDDGSLREASRSGGLRLHLLPDGCRASLVVSYQELDEETEEELEERGWARGASLLTGDALRDRSYSDEGYGVIREFVGEW